VASFALERRRLTSALSSRQGRSFDMTLTNGRLHRERSDCRPLDCRFVRAVLGDRLSEREREFIARLEKFDGPYPLAAFRQWDCQRRLMNPMRAQVFS